MVGQHGGIARAEPAEDFGAALHIGEEQCDGPVGRFAHCISHGMRAAHSLITPGA